MIFLSFDVVLEVEETLLARLGLENLFRFSENEPEISYTFLCKIQAAFPMFLPCSKSIRLIFPRILERLDFSDFEIQSG